YFQAEDGIRDFHVTGVQTCALPIYQTGVSHLTSLNIKKAPCSFLKGLSCKIRHRPTLPPVTAIPSALAGLTSLFGMGRGRHRRRSEERRVGKEWRSRWPQDA